MRDSEIFDEAVKTYYEPIAQELGLPITKVSDGIYEICSSYFIVRVRLDTGHHRGLNVILRQASPDNSDERKAFTQYGIGCFMEFYGEDLQQTFIEVDSDANFLKLAQLLATATRSYGIPYLMGKGKDFEAIKEIVKKKAEESVEKIKKYRFPKNVREEWLLPED